MPTNVTAVTLVRKGAPAAADDPERACRQALRAAGVTAAEIVRRAGVSKAQAQRMMAGDARVQGRVLVAFPRALTLLDAHVGASGRAAPAEAGLRRITAELGELARAVDLGLADGDLDAAERSAIERELLDLIERAQETLRGVRAG